MTYYGNILTIIDAAFAMIVREENKRNIYRILLGVIAAAALFSLYIGVSGFMSGNAVIGFIQVGVAVLLGFALLVIHLYASLIRGAMNKNESNPT